LDFIGFTGFALDIEKLPDETTICRFRNRLGVLRLDRALFEAINSQLEKHGLMIKNASTAIVDATVINSANWPRRCIEGYMNREATQEPFAM